MERTIDFKINFLLDTFQLEFNVGSSEIIKSI